MQPFSHGGVWKKMIAGINGYSINLDTRTLFLK